MRPSDLFAPLKYALDPLSRAETAWVAPWLLTRVSQHGLMHYEQGEPSDDFHLVGGVNNAFWMIAADGVGQSIYSRFASKIACRAVEEHLGHHVSSNTPLTTDLMKEAFAAAHNAIIAFAIERKHTIEHYHSTLVAVAGQNNRLIGGCIGDSGIAIGTSPEHDPETLALVPFCSAPSRSGNATYSIAQPDWMTNAVFTQSLSDEVIMAIVATDGAEDFYLKDAKRDEHLFDPIWPKIVMRKLAEFTPRLYANLHAAYLQDQMKEHDDRTFLVAYRPPQHLAPPPHTPRTL